VDTGSTTVRPARSPPFNLVSSFSPVEGLYCLILSLKRQCARMQCISAASKSGFTVLETFCYIPKAILNGEGNTVYNSVSFALGFGS
jgi:hypothetical protein